MSATGDGGPTEPWRAWSEAVALGWTAATGHGAGGSSAGAGLDALAAWYGRASEDLRDLLLAAPADPAGFQRRLASFATSFFTAGAPGVAGSAAWPGVGPFGYGWPGFGPAPAPAAPGPATAPAALGPAREHQQRVAALAAALAELAAARQALLPLLSGAAHAAADAFAARLRSGPAPGSRAAFDLWIDCAESAWLDLAHGEAWCAAQARAFDAALSVFACQQELAEHAARLAGVPGRREVDELHRRVRDLERARE